MAVLLLSGCAHFHTIPLGEHESFYEHVTEAAEGRTVRIGLVSGNTVTAAHVRVAVDSVRWLVPDIWSRQFTQPRAVATSEVREIIIRKPVKGGLIGTVLGFVGVMAFTAIPASTQNNRDLGNVLTISSLIGLAGGVGGAYAGARRAERDIYVFSEFMEGTDRYQIDQQLEGMGPGIAELIEQLRTTIRGIDNQKIREQVTETNIVYLLDDQQFCYLVADDNMVRIFLSAKPSEVQDPMGLVRPWSTEDSWFSITPGGDLEYAKLIISQVYRQVR